MKLNPRQTLARQRISKISIAINEAVNKICEEENFEVTYTEIQAGVIKALSEFNGLELRSLWEDPNEEEKFNEET